MTLGLGMDEDVGGQILWPDVIVHPTQEQIEAGSELIPPTEMPSEITCAICMEHDRRGEFNTTWRRLDCHHDFHQPCIDQWYTTSVHCPVCRHDIREPI
jgi:transposase